MITLQDVARARKTIAPIAYRTPLVEAGDLSRHTSGAVYLKLETLQPTGAFKVRGAANKILSLSEEEKKRGVVTVSTGNHGRAVAFVARSLGITAAICVSARVPENKINALRALGSEVVIYGQSQDEAAVRAAELQAERGLIMVHPFDDPHIIAGQGTIGLEILEDAPEIDSVLVPLSGGGLISGIALALKATNPTIRVIGISMERGAAMQASLQAGHPVEVPEADSLADSLGGGVGLDNRYTFSMVQRYVDEVILLSEDEIAAGMAYALNELKLVVEGAGAVGLAALLAGKVADLGQHIALVVSGGNVDPAQLLKIMNY